MKRTGYAYAYDLQGRIKSMTGPDGTVLQFNTYDRAGRLMRQTDGMDAGIEYIHNLANNPARRDRKGDGIHLQRV